MALIERRQGIGVSDGNATEQGGIVQVILAVLTSGFAHEAQRHLLYSVQLTKRFVAVPVCPCDPGCQETTNTPVIPALAWYWQWNG